MTSTAPVGTRAELRRARARARRRRLAAVGASSAGLLAVAGAALIIAVPGPADAGATAAASDGAPDDAPALQVFTAGGAEGSAAAENAVERDSAAVSVMDTSPAALKLVAAQMIRDQKGWGADQMQCLDQLWTKESGWRWDATNAESGAYGIPQSWPAEKLATAGADWRTNPVTQMQWGIDYIAAAHGTPCAAWYQHNGSY